MMRLKTFAVAIVATFLVGCDLPDDIRALKTDIRAFKAYLRSIPPPNDCGFPGTPQPRLCYYKLKVKPDGKAPKGSFIGHIPKEVVEEGYTACMEYKDKIPDKDFACQEAKSYRYAWFGFKIYGDIPDLTKNVAYEFVNVPNSDFLRLGTPHEVVVKDP
jgi:hypothetical protein